MTKVILAGEISEILSTTLGIYLFVLTEAMRVGNCASNAEEEPPEAVENESMKLGPSQRMQSRPPTKERLATV